MASPKMFAMPPADGGVLGRLICKLRLSLRLRPLRPLRWLRGLLLKLLFLLLVLLSRYPTPLTVGDDKALVSENCHDVLERAPLVGGRQIQQIGGIES